MTDVRLSVRVGLDTRLLCGDVGMPSRMLNGLSSVNEFGRTPLTRGNGRLLSGPANPDSTSNEDRRLILVAAPLVLPVEGVCECERALEGEGSSNSSGDMGGEFIMPGGRGRGRGPEGCENIDSDGSCCGG